jgi:uncharacterized damage-inducible protein DinB
MTQSALSKSRFEEICSILSSTPHVLEALTCNLPQRLLEADEGPGTWSPMEVVAHLVGAERTNWMQRLRVVFIDVDKNFRPFDRDSMLPQEGRRPSLNKLLDEFRALRQQNLTELNRFWAEGREWSATAIHPDFGKVTAEQLVSTWAVHDLGHLAQIERVLAKNWKEGIGPWQAYLSIVHWNGSAQAAVSSKA